MSSGGSQSQLDRGSQQRQPDKAFHPLNTPISVKPPATKAQAGTGGKGGNMSAPSGTLSSRLAAALPGQQMLLYKAKTKEQDDR